MFRLHNLFYCTWLATVDNTLCNAKHQFIKVNKSAQTFGRPEKETIEIVLQY